MPNYWRGSCHQTSHPYRREILVPPPSPSPFRWFSATLFSRPNWTIIKFYVASQSCTLTLMIFWNAAIFVTIKSQSSGRNQLSNKLGTSTPSARLKLAATFVARYQPSFPHHSYCICKSSFASLRCPRSMYVFGNVYRSILVSLFWGCFRLHICKHVHGFSIQVIAPYPPRSLLLSHRISWATGCILHVLPLKHHERHFMFIHSTLLYLSLDGVIPEASIYVYSI